MEERGSIQWLAVYRDGSFLPQYDGDKENKYTDIDRANLGAMTLTREGLPIFTLYFDRPDQKLILRRRYFMRQGEEGKSMIYLIGCHRNVAGENIQQLAVVMEDGSVCMFSKWQENHPLFDSVEFLPCEE